MEHATSISFDPQDGRFIPDQNFFDFFKMEDENRRNDFKKRTEIAQRAISIILCDRLEQSCSMKNTDPYLVYKIGKNIGKGAFGTVFKVKRHADGKCFALKYTSPKDMIERRNVLNECSLIMHLNCE